MQILPDPSSSNEACARLQAEKAAPGKIPDIIAVRRDKKIDVIEIQSPSQTSDSGLLELRRGVEEAFGNLNPEEAWRRGESKIFDVTGNPIQ